MINRKRQLFGLLAALLVLFSFALLLLPPAAAPEPPATPLRLVAHAGGVTPSGNPDRHQCHFLPTWRVVMLAKIYRTSGAKPERRFGRS